MPQSDNTIKAAAARLRREADAMLVLVITPNHVFYSDDPRLSPSDALRVLTEEASTIANHMKSSRQKQLSAGATK